MSGICDAARVFHLLLPLAFGLVTLELVARQPRRLGSRVGVWSLGVAAASVWVAVFAFAAAVAAIGIAHAARPRLGRVCALQGDVHGLGLAPGLVALVAALVILARSVRGPRPTPTAWLVRCATTLPAAVAFLPRTTAALEYLALHLGDQRDASKRSPDAVITDLASPVWVPHRDDRIAALAPTGPALLSLRRTAVVLVGGVLASSSAGYAALHVSGWATSVCLA